LPGPWPARMLRAVPIRTLRPIPTATALTPNVANAARAAIPAPPISLSAAALALALVLTLGCQDTRSSEAGSSAATEASRNAAKAASPGQSNPDVKPVAHRHDERPLPAFEGRTLAGERLAISSLIGKRLVLFFFNPEVASAEVVSRAVTAVAAQRGEFNFNVVGVAIGSNAVAANTFVKKLGFDFPVIDDSRGRVTAKLGLRAPVMLLSVDPEGFLGDLAMGSFSTDGDDAWKTIANQIRDKLRIPAPQHETAGLLDQRPLAPDFETVHLSGGETFKLASLEGKPLVLIFFLHTCPHCHKALQFLQQQLEKIEADKRPALVSVSIARSAGDSAVRSSLRDQGIVDDFPILSDPTGDLATAYGVFGGVPVIYLIDRDRRIAQRVQGWEGGREKALVGMQLAQIAGARVPLLLNHKGYTGADVCGVCHAKEYATWKFTDHSSAYDTLITHGQERDAECVSCHVAGFD